jgi:hypothetical protein
LTDDLELIARTVGDADIKPTPAETLLARIAASAEVPHRFRRIAARSSKWDIPRSFVGYRVDPTVQTLGYAPKWVLVSDRGGPEYIVKLPYKGGLTETLTELLINQLGAAWRFDVAHSGLASIDNRIGFITRSFLAPDEHLVHGSFLIEELFQAPHGELDTVPKGRREQEFYSIDFVVKMIETYCGSAATAVVDKFVEMLLFDALVGSTDRHAQNWGVIRASKTQGGYRFSPIFDTSRGLFWNLTDDKLLPIQQDDTLLRNHIDRACPVMGPERTTLKSAKKCNHIQFLCNLFSVFPHLRLRAVTKVPCNLEKTTTSIINSFPFCGAFSRLRRDTILKLILRRADMVSQVLEAGGGGT